MQLKNSHPGAFPRNLSTFKEERNVKTNKLMALVLAAVMVLSLIPAAAADNAPSLDFEDGSMAFAAVYDGMANSASAALEIAEFNGSKALKVTNGNGKVPYVAFDVVSLLGEKAAEVSAVEMTLGIENPDGKFFACSGELKLFVDGELSKTVRPWSVYMEKKNPKVASFAMDGEAFSAESAPVMVLSLNVDNGIAKGAAPAVLYVDDVRFLDAQGEVIPADSSASFVAPEGFGGGADMTNLQYLGADAVELEGMAGKAAGAWAQDGVEMTEEFKAALVPGAVIEISYSSESGDMWIVLPDAAAGWTRIEQQTAVTNLSHSTAQITFEQIAAVLGEDVSAWGARLQCEASGAWEVYAVKVGQPTGLKNLANKVSIDGFAKSGAAWAQDGIELTEEQWAMMKPGAVIEINYSSASGDMWIVLPDAAAGWTRIEQQTAPCNGSVCQISFEQIAAVLGEDVSTWGARLQCEASGDWEVYGVSIASAEFIPTKGNVAIEGFAPTGAAWAQDGIELTEEQLAMLVPGSVITIQYESENGDLWIVMPDAAAGWSRIQQQTAACDGSVCQITYEQIAEVCGEDVSAWGARLQCEASGAWQVFAAYIGSAA